MNFPIHPLLLTCVIVLSAFDILHAAPPPELTVLRQQYDKVFAERVTAVHEANVAALDAKFTTALDNAIAQAKAAGDLSTVLAIQGDKKLLAEKQPLPGDEDTAPEALKKLRGIYRDQLARLTEQRTANTAALLTPYAAKLQALEATLTKNDRVEEAKEVMDYRGELRADAPAPAPAAAASGVPAAPPAPAAADLPKGDDRKAAEWVLGIGGTVQVLGKNEVIATADDLPRGRFSVTQVILPTPMPEVPETDFDKLANLSELNSFSSSGGENQRDEAFRFLSSCPNLTQVDVQNWTKLEGRWLHYLVPLKRLGRLITTASVSSDVSALSKLNGESLFHLDLRGSPADDATLGVISGFKNLRFLNLRTTRVTDQGVRALVPLRVLETFNVQETDVSVESLRLLVKAPIKHLGFGRLPAEYTAAAPELGRLFPKLEFVFMPAGTLTAVDVKAVGSAWPKLKEFEIASATDLEEDTFAHLDESLPGLVALQLSKSKITDHHMILISRHKKLTKLIVVESTLTDACLPALQAMKSLKQLWLGRSGVTPAALEAFKKQRPDIKFARW